MVSFTEKIKRKAKSILVNKLKNKPYYFKLYKAYWHTIWHKRSEKKLQNSATLYFSATPHSGAGIGHQMANWIAGYWFAHQFGLRFAHIPFSSSAWDSFLGFGQGEILASELVHKKKYKKVTLPLFDENKQEEILRIKKIINSYIGKKVVFVCEQDQFYKDQFGVIEDIKRKFYNAPERFNDHLIFDNKTFNVVAHIRRGDIVKNGSERNDNLTKRFQDNQYFVDALHKALEIVKTDKAIVIYIFSQGLPSDYKEFESFKNLHLCLDMNAMDSFLHMVFADVLITSKSSFSYKPALLNNGLKIVPNFFWHSYPGTNDWIIM